MRALFSRESEGGRVRSGRPDTAALDGRLAASREPSRKIEKSSASTVNSLIFSPTLLPLPFASSRSKAAYVDVRPKTRDSFSADGSVGSGGLPKTGNLDHSSFHGITS